MYFDLNITFGVLLYGRWLKMVDVRGRGRGGCRKWFPIQMISIAVFVGHERLDWRPSRAAHHHQGPRGELHLATVAVARDACIEHGRLGRGLLIELFTENALLQGGSGRRRRRSIAQTTIAEGNDHGNAQCQRWEGDHLRQATVDGSDGIGTEIASKFKVSKLPKRPLPLTFDKFAPTPVNSRGNPPVQGP